MSVSVSTTNKPLNPRAQDLSPKGYNRAALYSGKALDFDGVNDQVDITTSDLDFGANDFSVSAIVDWSGSLVDGKLAYAERGSSGSALAAWQIRTQANGDMLFQANTASNGWKDVTFGGVGEIIQSGLTHLTFVRVGTGVTLYINGVFYSTGTGSIQATLDVANGAFAIGNRIGSANYWNGKIGQYKIFNTALTAAQVADLYNNPEKVVPTGVDNTALKLWLPMQEGAGTTAYDGSGNGNHGTISGATYVHGIGAPVSQTAVIDWNKGTNLLEYSEEFDNAYWSKDDVIISANDTTAPDGQTTAERITDNTNNARHRVLVLTSLTNSSSKATASVFVKEGTHRYAFLETSAGLSIYTIVADLQTGTITDETGNVTKDDSSITSYGNGWYRISVSITAASNNTSYIQFGPAGSATPSYNNYVPIYTGSGEYIYGWGAQVEEADSLGSYIRTEVSKQTSPVLLPQGLTTGRDITGVNLFENVRKQGALNLDGNSWAEVHDNESLDFGTGSFTLEAWVNAKFSGLGSTLNTILALGGNANSSSTTAICINTASIVPRFYINGTSQDASAGQTDGDWVHIVGVRDATSQKIYVNGVFDSQTTATGTISNDLIKYIGRDASTPNDRFYSSQIAQPRIYNRALTAEEVQRNYNAGKNIYTN